ncbi:hypothetical protein OMCYN_01384 [cyanobiont of Ornithocercus magnificus]|nr:hypothetical protein OMCYN_01384 [cyanobiont of Ornithocercus magnificus]
MRLNTGFVCGARAVAAFSKQYMLALARLQRPSLSFADFEVLPSAKLSNGY